MQLTTSRGRELLEAGRLAEAREQLWHEAQVAETEGDAVSFAAAALGLGGIWVHEHRSTLELARVVELQRRALGGIEPTNPLSHRLRLRLAAESAYTSGHASSLLTELEAARERDDPVALAEGLSMVHHCLLGPHHGTLRMRLADELIGVSIRTGRPIDQLMGLSWRTIDLVLAGDRRSARSLRELRELLVASPCEGLSYLVAALDVTAAMRAGRLVEAEQRAEACLRLGMEVGDADALGWYGAQLVAIRWFQGRGGEVLPTVVEMSQSTTVAELNHGFAAAIAALAAASGDHGSARTALAGLRANGLRSVPTCSTWMVTLLGVCEAAHALHDVDAAAEAYELLEPFAALPVMASLGVACFGSAQRPLALAAWTIGDLDRAIEHLESALLADLALDNRPCHAMDAALLAEALELRGQAGDADRASALWGIAIDEGRRCGMTDRVRGWESAGERASGSDVVCRREGRAWLVTAGDRRALVPDSVGVRYLTELIARVGVAIPSIELASDHVLVDRGSRDDVVLDADAKAAYRRRIEDLHSEVEDAEACADLERASRARVELDRFVEELARCTGLAGRARFFPRDAERARVSVRKAIARAVRVITEIDHALGREIGARVVTGTTCVFLARAPGSPALARGTLDPRTDLRS